MKLNLVRRYIIVGMGLRVGNGREVMMMVMMKLLLLMSDILTKFVAAELLLADVDGSPQTQAWYSLTF